MVNSHVERETSAGGKILTHAAAALARRQGAFAEDRGRYSNAAAAQQAYTFVETPNLAVDIAGNEAVEYHGKDQTVAPR